MNRTNIFFTSVQILILLILMPLTSIAQLIPFLEGEKYGYSNLEGKLLVSAQYDYASGFKYNGRAIVRKGYKWWILNASGQEIRKVEEIGNINKGFDQLEYVNGSTKGKEGYFHFQLNDKFGILNDNLKLVYEEIIDEQFEVNLQSKTVRYNSFILKRKVLAGKATEYSCIDLLSKNEIPNTVGKKVSALFIEERDSLILFKVKNNGKLSIVDFTGNVKLELDDKESNFEHYIVDSTLFFISYGYNYFTAYDEFFNVIIPSTTLGAYQDSSFFEKYDQEFQLLVASKGFNNHRLVKCFYNSEFQKCVCHSNKNYRVAPIYSNGKNITPKHSSVYNIKDGFFIYQTNGMFAINNINGENTIPFSKTGFLFASRSEIIKKIDDTWTFRDYYGNITRNQEFSNVSPSYLKEKESQKFAYHKNYVTKTPFKYDTIMTNPNTGWLIGSIGNQFVLLDTSGREVSKFEHESIEPNGVCYTTKQNELYGLMTNDGKEYFKPKYQEIKLFSKKQELFEALDANMERILLTSKGHKLCLSIEEVKKGDLKLLYDYYYVYILDNIYTFIDPKGNAISSINKNDLCDQKDGFECFFYPIKKNEHYYKRRGHIKIPGVIWCEDTFYNYYTGVIYKN